MYTLWFVWAIMFIDLVASVPIPLIVSMHPMHIMSSILWSFQFPKIWDIASMQKHMISFNPNFSQNPNFTSIWIFMSQSKPKLTRMCLWHIHQSFVTRSKWTPSIVHVNAFWFKIQNCSSIVWCFRLSPNHVDSHSQEHIRTSNAETSRYRWGMTWAEIC
jgi:hypothetical protein